MKQQIKIITAEDDPNEFVRKLLALDREIVQIVPYPEDENGKQRYILIYQDK